MSDNVTMFLMTFIFFGWIPIWALSVGISTIVRAYNESRYGTEDEE